MPTRPVCAFNQEIKQVQQEKSGQTQKADATKNCVICQDATIAMIELYSVEISLVEIVTIPLQ
jgi:hypothetical protein